VTRGLGTRAANRAMKSSGSKILEVIYKIEITAKVPVDI
jgi:hypothetical protein